MLKRINPENMPVPVGYALAMEASAVQRTLFISGQVGVGADGKPAKGVRAQTEAATANLQSVLAAADMDISNVAKYTIFLTDENSVDEFFAGSKTLMPVPTAATLVFVKGLASPDFLVEIEAIAVK